MRLMILSGSQLGWFGRVDSDTVSILELFMGRGGFSK